MSPDRNRGEDEAGHSGPSAAYGPARILLARNRQGRDLFVGDIQGYFGHLERLLELAGFASDTDRLIAVGDLVDRGPGSIEVIEHYARADWFHSVLGNHDAMALACIDRRPDHCLPVWLANGGGWDTLLDSGRQRQRIIAALASLPLTIEVPLANGLRAGVIHAQLGPGMDWAELAKIDSERIRPFLDLPPDPAGEALWGRSRCAAALAVRQAGVGMPDRRQDALPAVAGVDLLIAGHTRVMHPAIPMRAANMLWIDTGSDQPDGALSIIDPVTNHYWQLQDCARSAAGDCGFSEGEIPAGL